MTDNAHAENIQKLNSLVKDIDFCMLTTVDEDGTLRSRPMSTQDFEFNGDLWFFTLASTAKVYEIQRERQVNVSYADPSHDRYVSVSGLATLVRDPRKINEYWNPALEAWFPDGKDNPDLALLKVRVEKAEYWNNPQPKVVQVLAFAKALVTGEEADYGENEKLDL